MEEGGAFGQRSGLRTGLSVRVYMRQMTLHWSANRSTVCGDEVTARQVPRRQVFQFQINPKISFSHGENR
jgi:hypothetical protein